MAGMVIMAAMATTAIMGGDTPAMAMIPTFPVMAMAGPGVPIRIEEGHRFSSRSAGMVITMIMVADMAIPVAEARTLTMAASAMAADMGTAAITDMAAMVTVAGTMVDMLATTRPLAADCEAAPAA